LSDLLHFAERNIEIFIYEEKNLEGALCTFLEDPEHALGIGLALLLAFLFRTGAGCRYRGA
jgi:hypothetical protein